MTQPMLPTPENEPWFGVAISAMRVCVEGDGVVGMSMVEALAKTYGWQALQSAMQVWADWAIAAAALPPAKTVRVLWRDVDTGEVTDADGTAAPVRWAGRMLAARANMDYATWSALLDSLEEDTVGPYVAAYVNMAARTIQAGQ